jgi:hypothetical protein
LASDSANQLRGVRLKRVEYGGSFNSLEVTFS